MSKEVTRNLEPLFNPHSIAIIGASADFSKVSGRPLRFLLDHGYKGKIYPVNPNCEEIGGVKCFKQILDLPGEIDLATIILPAKMVVGALEECIAKGVKAASIITSGFAELGAEGKKMQEMIQGVARRSGLLVSGPNSVGVHNFDTKAFPSISQLFERKDLLSGPIAFISQSGAFGTAICAMAQERQVGFTYFLSSGNEADLELADYIDYAIDDPKIRVISGYVEGIRNGRKFMEVAKKSIEKGKPIVMVKVGRFNAGTRAASSHTGSMTGSDVVYEAVFKQRGIIRANDVEELLDYSNIFALAKIRSGQSVGIISTSGGAGVLMADKCEELGLKVPELSQASKEKLQKILPAFSSLNNPVDTTGQFLTLPGAIKDCVMVLAEDEQIDVIVLFMALVWSQWAEIANDICNVAKNTDKLLVICWASAPKPALDLLRRNGIIVYPEPVRCIKSIAAFLNYGKTKEEFDSGDVKKNPIIKTPSSVESIIEHFKSIQGTGRAILTEMESKEVLKVYGIPVTREKVAKNQEEALIFAEEIGWPVALKISSPDITHKTESKAIALNVADPRHLGRAFQEVWQNAQTHNPMAKIEGILVQEMLGPGIEVIVGMSQDPQFGPVIIFGIGGIFVEIMQDVSLRVPPLSTYDTEIMIHSIKGFPLLKGVRGSREADIMAIQNVLLRVAQMSLDLKDYISELDINPLIVFEKGQGIKAVDALISLKTPV